MTAVAFPDDAAHQDNLLMAEVGELNEQLAPYLLRFLDADSRRPTHISTADERTRAERVGALAEVIRHRLTAATSTATLHRWSAHLDATSHEPTSHEPWTRRGCWPPWSGWPGGSSRTGSGTAAGTGGAAVGKHRRHEVDALLAVQQYVELVHVLHTHRPSERSGLSLACGIGWPCAEVWLPLERGRINGDLDEDSSPRTTRNGEQ